MTFKEYCKRELGYESQTTFWTDFSIADKFGKNAVKDTFNRAFNEWRKNHVYLTELVLVLNMKLWHFHNAGNDEMAALYDELWRKADGWAVENLTGKAAEYYFKVTD